MNILEDLKKCYPVENKHIVDFNAGWHECLEDIQAEYDLLCPKPSEFPEGYEWYSIDAYQVNIFHKEKPNYYDVNRVCWEDNVESWLPKHMSYNTKIPLGLDWRLCVWSIEDAKRIWGEE